MIGAPQIEIVAAAVIPTFAFVLNWSMRSRNGYALSAAADFALALASFDLVALVYSNVFSEVMRNQIFQQSFNRLEIILFVLTAITWMTLFLRLEHRMTEGYDFHRKRYLHGRPMGAFLLGWGVLAGFLGVLSWRAYLSIRIRVNAHVSLCCDGPHRIDRWTVGSSDRHRRCEARNL